MHESVSFESRILQNTDEESFARQECGEAGTSVLLEYFWITTIPLENRSRDGVVFVRSRFLTISDAMSYVLSPSLKWVIALMSIEFVCGMMIHSDMQNLAGFTLRVGVASALRMSSRFTFHVQVIYHHCQSHDGEV